MNLKQVYKEYPTTESCIAFLEKVRWDLKPVCPYCGSTYQTPAPKESRYHCNNCNSSYSVTVRTMFHKTRCDLQKWFYAINIYLNENRKITARDLADKIGVTKDTAWRMIAAIKKEIESGNNWIYKTIKIKS